jgi:hypothetical protein
MMEVTSGPSLFRMVRYWQDKVYAPVFRLQRGGRRIMNRTIRTVTGTLVQSVANDKLDALAKLLGLDATETAKLKSAGNVSVVTHEGTKPSG